jgi:hypothetical protein
MFRLSNEGNILSNTNSSAHFHSYFKPFNLTGLMFVKHVMHGMEWLHDTLYTKGGPEQNENYHLSAQYLL